jgi:hypothetical protein
MILFGEITLYMVIQFALKFRSILNQPLKVFFICTVVLFASLLVNGALWRVWGLHRDISVIVHIKQAKDPVYIERLAKDKLDLVNRDDLVFVFAD